MALRFITIEELQAHCVADGDLQDGLEAKGEAAEHLAEMEMNRALFATEEALDEARASARDALASARTAYDEAVAAADGDADLLVAAEHAYAAARVEAFRILHGIVINPAIKGAILMSACHLWTNRSDVVEGNPVRVPQNSRDIYAKYRYLGGTFL